MKHAQNNIPAPAGQAIEYCSECGAPKSCNTGALMSGIPTSLFFSKKGLLRAMNECTGPDELMRLYEENKNRIEESPELQQMFMGLKKEWCNDNN